MTNGATPEQVAQWMVGELDRVQLLYQETVVYEIHSRFGAEFTYNNANGNLAISKEVLKAFRMLTGDAVIWERGSRMWRKRATHDSAGRQQE